MGHHSARHLETARQAVHETSCLSGECGGGAGGDAAAAALETRLTARHFGAKEDLVQSCLL